MVTLWDWRGGGDGTKGIEIVIRETVIIKVERRGLAGEEVRKKGKIREDKGFKIREKEEGNGEGREGKKKRQKGKKKNVKRR